MTGALLPDVARPSLILACAVWGAVLAAEASSAALVPWAIGAVLVSRRPGAAGDPSPAPSSPWSKVPWVVVGLVAGLVAGAAWQAREAAVLDGGKVDRLSVRAEVALAEDPIRSVHGVVALGRADLPGWGTVPVRVRWKDDPGDVLAGERLVVRGTAGGSPGRLRDDPYRMTLDVRTVEEVRPARDPFRRTANGLRRHLLAGLGATRDDPARALIAGFLVGATEDLPPATVDRLRRAGLSHYVAVSGSNVALFMAALWLLLGPLAMGRARLWLGLLGLGVFVALTRWEPSVLRAGAMAAVVLGGRAAGVPIGTWEGLGWGTAGALLVAPELADRLGFQLSVAATVGILVGATRTSRDRVGVAVLRAAIAAQVAVAPILLATVGSVPLLSPIANVLAAPLVSAATIVGGLGALLHVRPLVAVGAVAARGVLAIAGSAAAFEELGVVEVVTALGLGWVAWRRPKVRPYVALVLAVGLALIALPAATSEGGDRVVFLDVGQGDAALIEVGGMHVLVDGGPDPARILTALDRRGVRALDLVVLSHPHDDHARGLEALVGVLPIGWLWHPGHPEPGPAARRLLARAAAAGIPVTVPEVGTSIVADGGRIDVLGPRRRYASPNDMSLVFRLTLRTRTFLFPGDVETVAQRELRPTPVDVLKVPHQGAATSDVRWLQAIGADLAVVSVGPNAFGHPDEATLDALDEVGRVLRTDVVGDITVRVGGDGRLVVTTERSP